MLVSLEIPKLEFEVKIILKRYDCFAQTLSKEMLLSQDNYMYMYVYIGKIILHVPYSFGESFVDVKGR